MVKLLALAPDRRVHRERLAELLWPDRDADAAANNLNQALYAARRALDSAGADGAAVLAMTDGAVVLRAQVDVDAFEAAAARAHAERDPAGYERALALYGGELLPEDRYEPWADARRAALAEQHTMLCLELAESHGDTPAAVDALQRALVADPLAEPVHRALMRRYARAGRRQQALAQYQLLRQGLDAELAAEPDPATRTLYQQLLAPAPVAAGMAAGGGNLPRQLTSFVGRGRERAELARLLGRTRLVTLTGPGGCGKTRLALEAAADAIPGLPDGAWLVDLAGLDDPALVAQAAALAVGVPIPAARSAQDALVAYLATRETLIVLDNCEHLIDACARLAEELLRAGPGVRVLATSREPLRCDGEVPWRVPALAEAERLFCERAAGARAGFDAAGHGDVVAEICLRLDGMPLAIELAAARAAALPLDQIAERLGESLDMLGQGRRTALTRQQTLRATIDWSHDLLTGEERVLLRRLAVFAGGFALGAAEEVCAGGAIAGRHVADLLARLVEKSLVVAEGDRFRLLDTVRQYAAERLEAAAERETVASRHLAWCLALAEGHDPLSAGRRRSLHILESEHDNLRTGLAYAVRRDPRSALRLATRLWRFWLDRGYFAEGNRWLQTTLAAAPEHTSVRVEALLAGAGLCLRLGDSNGFLRHVGDAVRAYRLLGDDRATAAALYQHAMLAQYVHRDDAEALFAEALALARRLDDNRLLAAATHASATLPWYRGDHATARARVLAALDLLGAASDDAEAPFFDGVTFGMCLLDEGAQRRPRLVWEETVFLFHRFTRAPATAYALNNLAWAARADGDPDGAEAMLHDALARFRRLEDRRGEALSLGHLGNLSRSHGDPEAARAHLERALAIRSELGDRRAMLITRIGLGLLAMTAGDAAEGRALLGGALAHAEAIDDLPAMAGTQMDWAIGEERLGELDRAAELYEDAGALLGLQRLLRFEAWSRMALHDVCLALGDEPRARTALQRARALFVAVGDARGLSSTAAKPALSGVKDRGA